MLSLEQVANQATCCYGFSDTRAIEMDNVEKCSTVLSNQAKVQLHSSSFFSFFPLSNCFPLHLFLLKQVTANLEESLQRKESSVAIITAELQTLHQEIQQLGSAR